MEKNNLKRLLNINPIIRQMILLLKKQIFISVSLIMLINIFSISLKAQNKVADSIRFQKIDSLINNKFFKEAIDEINSVTYVNQKEKEWNLFYKCQIYLFRIGRSKGTFKNEYSIIKRNFEGIPVESEFKAKTALILAYIADELSLFVEGEYYYRYCISEFRKNDALIDLSKAYINFGIFCMKLNNHILAIKNLKESLELSLYLKNDKLKSKVLRNLLNAYYYNGDYNKALHILSMYKGSNIFGRRYYNYQMAKIHLAQGLYNKVPIYIEDASKTKGSELISDVDLVSIKAEYFIQMNQYTAALKLLHSIEEGILKIPDLREHGKYYHSLVAAYKGISDWDNAYLFLGKSWDIFYQKTNSIKEYSLISSHKYLYHEIHILEIFKYLSEYYIHKFKLSKSEMHRNHAIRCIDYMIESLNYKKSYLENLGSQQKISDHFTSHFEESVLTYLKWYEETKDDQYLDAAFKVSQKQNAYQLKQFVNERVTLRKLKVDTSLSNEYLKAQLVFNQNSLQVSKEFSIESFKKYKDSEEIYNELKKELIEKYPKFMALKNDFSASSIKKIQAELNDKTAIIKYFSGQEKLISFVISKENSEYHIHNKISNIDNDVQKFRKQILDFSVNLSNNKSKEKQFMDAAFNLSRKVILSELSTLSKNIKKLIIIPSGSLKQIPFESLAIKPMKNWSNPEAFLLNEYIVSYAYYTQQAVSKKVSKDLKKVLTYGLEYDDFTLESMKKNLGDSVTLNIADEYRFSEFSHTYFADDEAVEIANMFDGLAFINENATKESFLENVTNFDIIHISAHSYINLDRPDKSSIILHKEDESTDNLIHTKDIRNLNLDGQFITLSACNTSFGKNHKGEGLASIAKSFTESGAGAVMGSFWPVPDEISKSFMSNFYKKLKSGLTKDEALQSAKLEFLTNDDKYSPMYRSPFYWSTWILYGDTDELLASKNKSYLLYGIGLVLLLSLYSYFFLKKKKSSY